MTTINTETKIPTTDEMKPKDYSNGTLGRTPSSSSSSPSSNIRTR
jgi:hypothetical protein